MEELGNPFRKFIDNTGEKIFSFAKRAYIAPTTLYNIYNGVWPRRNLASKICKHSKGNLTLKDFGYE